MKHEDTSLEDIMPPTENVRGTGPNKGPTAVALSAGESRRRFVKGTLAVAPVLMTVVSRPAWGNVCAPSGMVSGNLSTPGGVTLTCALGNSPDEWNEISDWPKDKNSYFDVLFLGVGQHEKIKKIIQDVDNETFTEFERAAVAALLNSVILTMDYLNTDMVICMVQDVLVDGVYMVTADCPWDMNQVLTYFTLTWTAGALPLQPI